MAELMQSVMSMLDEDRVNAMARQIGASPQQTENAIQAALPLLVAQMARNSTQPQGAQALHAALERDHAGVDVGGLLGAVLGGRGGTGGAGGLLGDVLGSVLGGGAGAGSRPTSQAGGDVISNGMAILGHVFGQKQQRVTRGVGQLGGMSGQQSSQLLAMLAPIVMAVLSKMMQGRGGGAQALGGLLGGENQQVQQNPGAGGVVKALLDRDGDGDVDLSDLMQGGQLLGGLLGRR